VISLQVGLFLFCLRGCDESPSSILIFIYLAPPSVLFFFRDFLVGRVRTNLTHFYLWGALCR